MTWQIMEVPITGEGWEGGGQLLIYLFQYLYIRSLGCISYSILDIPSALYHLFLIA
jgi:hypothetical protein